METGWTIYFAVNEKLQFNVSLDGFKLPQNHDINRQWPESQKCKLNSILKFIDNLQVCVGIKAKKIEKLPNTTISRAIHNESFNVGETYEVLECMRTLKCSCLIEVGDQLRCTFCFNFIIPESSGLHPKASLSQASHTQLEKMVKQNRCEINKMKSKINSLVKKIDEKGVLLENELANNFEAIVEKNGDEFFKLFFKEQKKRWLGKAGRWHPMLIRYALLLHSRSPSAYNLLRDTGVLKLPSSKTLKDYTHYIKPQCGFQFERIDELKNSVNNLKGHQRCVGLIFDEMKIFESLVYHSDRLVGFVDLGSEHLIL